MIRRLLQKRRFEREHAWTYAHLSDYLDRELEGEQEERLEAHVTICPQCQRMLETLRGTVRALRGLRAPAAPGLADGIIERLRE